MSVATKTGFKQWILIIRGKHFFNLLSNWVPRPIREFFGVLECLYYTFDNIAHDKDRENKLLKTVQKEND